MTENQKRASEARDAGRVRAQAAERKRKQRDRDRVTSHAAAAPVTPKRAKVQPDERRVASRGRRDPYSSSGWGGRIPNPDPTLVKFAGGRGISLYTLILHQYANVAGFCQAWVDHVLVTNRTVKAAKATDPAQQDRADAAALRAQRAWERVENRLIVLQKLLMGRFYGFARAEKVLRFDPVTGDWIPHLYDVPQEAWQFDDDGRQYLITAAHPTGIEVDGSKFLHFQWGSADTLHGEGDLSKVYLPLWKTQKLETCLLQRIEDNESTVIVHVPRSITGPDRTDLETAYSEEYRKVILVPTEESQVRTEMPTLGITTSGAAGRQELETMRWYERMVQIALLGAPQTGDKSMGTGKLEETRKSVWDDKTPLGSAALDQCLNEGWMTTYCDLNMADLPVELRPRFDSDAADIADGLSGIQSQEARNIALDLAANRITASVAVELWSALGISRVKAQAMSDSIGKERGTLQIVEAKETQPTNPSIPPVAPQSPEDESGEEAA